MLATLVVVAKNPKSQWISLVIPNGQPIPLPIFQPMGMKRTFRQVLILILTLMRRNWNPKLMIITMITTITSQRRTPRSKHLAKRNRARYKRVHPERVHRGRVLKEKPERKARVPENHTNTATNTPMSQPSNLLLGRSVLPFKWM